MHMSSPQMMKQWRYGVCAIHTSFELSSPHETLMNMHLPPSMAGGLYVQLQDEATLCQLCANSVSALSQLYSKILSILSQ